MSHTVPKSTVHARRLRSAARLYAVQAMFQMEAAGAPLDEVEEEFVTHRIGTEVDGVFHADADVEYFRSLIRAGVEHQARIDQATDRALDARWPINRIDPTLRAVFRAAGGELVTAGIPPRVTINEFIEVTKAFFPEGKESAFVNAVLDRMAQDLRPTGSSG
jgi:transcription antitermination protein NusB